jgi:hypothetical protein
MSWTVKNKGRRPSSKPGRRVPPPSTNGHATPAADVTVATGSNGGGHTDHPPAHGRGANGRFTRGNRAAAGNPFCRAVAARRKALLDAISDEDVGRVARKLYEQALAGDTAAAKVLLLYVVGRPAEPANPDTLDQHELTLLLETPSAQALLAAAQDRLPAATALGVAEAVLQVAPQRLVQLLDAARLGPAAPPPMTHARLEQLLAEARSEPNEYEVNYPARAGGNPDPPTEESHP